MLIRHLGAFDGLRDWLTTGTNIIPLTDRAELGWFPPEALPEDGRSSQRRFAEKLSGELMGEGVRKGFTYRWIPNHLQDAHGLIVPRPFLNIVGFAAQWALQRGPKAQYSRLLHYTELQAALEQTSLYRAKELAEEHPVVQRLELLRNMVLLTDRRTLVGRLGSPAPRGRWLWHRRQRSVRGVGSPRRLESATRRSHRRPGHLSLRLCHQTQGGRRQTSLTITRFRAPASM